MIKRIINNRLISPTKVLHSDISNGLVKIGVLRFINSLFAGSKLGYAAVNRMHLEIIKKLENDYSDIINKYKNYKGNCEYSPNATIWVAWLQGYDNAPVLVKRCIDSIKKSTSHPVVIITRENISEYAKIPDYIMDKYGQGIISNAQFSDILRMSLLSEHGGLWIDATIFVPNKIPENVFYNEFYTCKRTPKISGYASQYRWTSFLNGCQKGCIIQKAMADLFFAYWKKNNYLIDYLLVDYFMLLVYKNIPTATELIDNLEYNNSQIEELQSRLNLPFVESEYKNLINQEETFLFKLSWRMKFELKNNGKDTYYSKFIND